MSGLSSTRRARAQSRHGGPQDYARRCRPEVARVGLFVDADDHSIAAVLDTAPLDMLQFHGHESPRRVAEAKARFQCKVMKAVAICRPGRSGRRRGLRRRCRHAVVRRQKPIRPDRCQAAMFRLRLGSKRPPFLAASMDAVQVAHESISRGGARLEISDRRRVLRRRNPAGAFGPGQDQRLSRRRPRALRSGPDQPSVLNNRLLWRRSSIRSSMARLRGDNRH